MLPDFALIALAIYLMSSLTRFELYQNTCLDCGGKGRHRKDCRAGKDD